MARRAMHSARLLLALPSSACPPRTHLPHTHAQHAHHPHRQLRPDDFGALKAAHAAVFPLDYEDSFYRAAVCSGSPPSPSSGRRAHDDCAFSAGDPSCNAPLPPGVPRQRQAAAAAVAGDIVARAAVQRCGRREERLVGFVTACVVRLEHVCRCVCCVYVCIVCAAAHFALWENVRARVTHIK